MENFRSPFSLGGTTTRVNQLAHLSLADGQDNTCVGLNTEYAGGANNTVVGAFAGVSVDDMSTDMVLVGARCGQDMQFSTNSVAVGAHAGHTAQNMHYSVVVGGGSGGFTQGAYYCTAVGYAAGAHMVGGLRNTALGAHAGMYAIDTADNTFVGESAGVACRGGSMNVCVGAGSGQGGNLGSQNVLIGFRAGGNISDDNNTVVGASAGANATGSDNTFLGAEAGMQGNNNVCVGYHAGNGTPQLMGDDNTFLGSKTGLSGNNNVCVGYLAGNGTSVSNSFNNTFVGTETGSTNGNNNVCVGFQAGNAAADYFMPTVPSGNNNANNTFVGVSAMLGGYDNVCVGHQAGYTDEQRYDGEQNVFVGKNSGQRTTGSVCVGYLAGTRDAPAYWVYNTFVGMESGQPGDHNVCVGYQSGSVTEPGFENTYVGSHTGIRGYNNVCVGYRSGVEPSTVYSYGDQNTCVGAFSGVQGHNTVCIGNQSGNVGGDPELTQRNVFIGSAVANKAVDVSDSLFLGFRAGQSASGASGVVALGTHVAKDAAGSQDSVFIGANTAMNTSGVRTIVIGPDLSPNTLTQSVVLGVNAATFAVGLNSIILGVDIAEGPASVTNSILLGTDLVLGGADLVNSVIIGSGVTIDPFGADSDKCIIGINGARAIEATADSLTLGEGINTFLHADASSFVLGPPFRPHMKVDRAPEGAFWNYSKTCFPASPNSQLRCLGYVEDTLVRADSIGINGTLATPILFNARPYASDADNQLPLDSESSWYGAPVYINAMGDLRYINTCFREELSANVYVDAIGQTLAGDSFSVEMWVSIGGGVNSSGPIFGSMNASEVALGQPDVTDWALGVSFYGTNGVGGNGTGRPMFQYTLSDGSGWMKLMANVAPLAAHYTWTHLAVIGEAGNLYMFVNGVRVEMFQVPFSVAFSDGLWVESYSNVTPVYSNVHVIPSAGFTAPGIRTGFQGPGLRAGRHYRFPSFPDPSPDYYQSCKTALVTEIMYRSPRFTDSDIGYANNIGGFPMPTSARAVPRKTGNGATVYITPVGETPVLGQNGMSELHGVRASGFELWPYTRPSDKSLWWQYWPQATWFPMPSTLPETSIRVYGGGCIQMQMMPIYLEATGKHGISTNHTGVFGGLPEGTVLWGETGSIACATPGVEVMANVQPVMTWSRTDVTLTANVAITLGGILKSNKTSITSGFAGGPRITQAAWDTPGTVHTININTLTNSCDDVSGVLYVHASSKAGNNKNGTMVLGVLKSVGLGVSATIMSTTKTAGLATFNMLTGTDIQIDTDAGCAICWTFMSAA